MVAIPGVADTDALDRDHSGIYVRQVLRPGYSKYYTCEEKKKEICQTDIKVHPPGEGTYSVNRQKSCIGGAMKKKYPDEYWSIESTPKDSFYDEKEMEFVREETYKTDPPRKYVYFADPLGRGWYKTMIFHGGRWISQEEYIFGTVKRKRRLV